MQHCHCLSPYRRKPVSSQNPCPRHRTIRWQSKSTRFPTSVPFPWLSLWLLRRGTNVGCLPDWLSSRPHQKTQNPGGTIDKLAKLCFQTLTSGSVQIERPLQQSGSRGWGGLYCQVGVLALLMPSCSVFKDTQIQIQRNAWSCKKKKRLKIGKTKSQAVFQFKKRGLRLSWVCGFHSVWSVAVQRPRPQGH